MGYVKRGRDAGGARKTRPAAEADRIDGVSYPLKWSPPPAPTKLANAAQRNWSRYEQEKARGDYDPGPKPTELEDSPNEYEEKMAMRAMLYGQRKYAPILKATFEDFSDSMVRAQKSLSYFGKQMSVEKPSRKSKTARKKTKKSKIVAPVVNKLTITRVPPTDEEV